MSVLRIQGFAIHKGYLALSAQRLLVDALRPVLDAAPPVHPHTPSGKRMSVRMTSAGRLGWISDRQGYRYSPTHPWGMPWPAIPVEVLAPWRELVSRTRNPDCCLVNHYGEAAHMGLHRDRDEADFAWPVLSVSLGDDGLFRMGGMQRGAKTVSHWLASGDVVVMGGAARLAYHGIDRIRFGSSRLLPEGGRMNLTMRVVT